MTTEALPAAIQVYDHEHANRYADPRLDYGYIDEVAAYVATCLRDKLTVEACYQPGDGTRYNLVFVPLPGITAAPPRHRGTDHAWEQHAVAGCRRTPDTQDFQVPGVYYAHDAVLVSWVENAAYPIKLTNEFSADYLAQKFKTTIVSGCSLAILFRAIAHHSTEARTL